MIQRIRNFENNFTIGKAALLIGILTLASRLLGFFRQFLFASKFGLSDTLDVYVTAFRIPDTIFSLLILGTLSVAFIPVFSELYMQDKEKAMKLASTVLNTALLFMLFVSIGLFIFMEPLTRLLVPGFAEDKLQQTVNLTRVILLSPIIFTISNVFSSVLTSFKRFFAVNIAAIFYNVGIIFGLLVLYPRMGLTGLGIGVLLGAALHALIQIPELLRTGFRWQPILDLRDAGFRKMARLFLPRIFGLDITAISLLIAAYVGSLLAEGSISAYNLANDLQALPIGLFALSTAAALFPILSQNFAQKDEDRFIHNLQKAILQILVFIIPVSIWMLIFRAQVVRLVYGHGEIGWEQTILLFNTLGVFTIALFSQSLTPLFARAFYARQNTKTPVIIGLFAMAINAVASYTLAQHFGVIGIVGGFVIASFTNVVLLFGALRVNMAKTAPHDLLHAFDTTLIKEVSKIALASLVAGVISYGYLYLIEPFVNTQLTVGIFVQVAFAGLAGLLGYIVLLYWMNNEFAHNILEKLKIKPSKSRE